MCKALFSVEHGSRSRIKLYKKEKTPCYSNASKSDRVTSYFIKRGPSGFTSRGLKIVVEGMFEFQIVKTR